MGSKIYVIGDAARLEGYSRDTLLRLEAKGLVVPQRDSANRRLYTEKDLEKIRAYRERQRRAPAPSR